MPPAGGRRWGGVPLRHRLRGCVRRRAGGVRKRGHGVSWDNSPAARKAGNHGFEGQPHHAGVEAFHPVHQRRTCTLDSVGSCLVEALTERDVGRGFAAAEGRNQTVLVTTEREEADAVGTGAGWPGPPPAKAPSRAHTVGTAGEGHQHLYSMGFVIGLLEQLAFEMNRGVGREDQCPRCCNGLGFSAAADIVHRVFARSGCFGDRGGRTAARGTPQASRAACGGGEIRWRGRASWPAPNSTRLRCFELRKTLRPVASRETARVGNGVRHLVLADLIFGDPVDEAKEGPDHTSMGDHEDCVGHALGLEHHQGGHGSPGQVLEGLSSGRTGWSSRSSVALSPRC